MAELKITRCKVCTSPLKAGATRCGKCGAEHSIEPAVVNPLRFTPEQVALYRAAFEEQVQENPRDTQALYATGLTYLGLKNYELANETLQKAVKLHPDNPDVYYYCALCFFRHRSVANLSKEEMERIEEWLQTAVQMQPKRKYLILQMILRQGMSSMGLNIDSYKEMPAELLEKARVTLQEEDELHEIEQHVLVTDAATRALLDRLAAPTKRQAASDDILAESMQAYADICDYPTQRDNMADYARAELLNDPDYRQDTLTTMYEPQKPQYDSYPSIIGLVWRIVIRTVVCAILFIVAALVADGVFDASLDCDTPVKSTEQRLAERIARAEASDKTPLPSELSDWKKSAEGAYEHDVKRLARYEADYETYAWWSYEADSLADDGRRRTLHWGTPTETELAENQQITICGLRKGKDGIIGLCIYAAVPLLWLIWLLAGIVSFIVRWRRIGQENSRKKTQYREFMNFHQTRPTVQDYKLFCQHYIGPNVGFVPQGDMVAMALRQAGISEEDVANGNGKIYFFACFLDIDDRDRETHDADVVLSAMGIDVCVALRDSIVCMSAIWRTAGDDLPAFEERNVMYNRISDFRIDPDRKVMQIICDGTVTANVSYGWKSYPSLFQYQSTNPRDSLTYSRTRTSNFNEFKNSLLKMHSAYVK